MKKILIIVFNLDNVGGVEKVITTKANYWAENDFKVTILQIHSINKPFFNLNKNIKHETLNHNQNYNGKIGVFKQLFKLTKLLNEYTKDKEFDFIISSWLMLNICLSLCNTKSKKIGCEHMAWHAQSYLLNKLRLLFYKKLDLLIVETQEDKLYYNSKKLKVKQIYNPIKIDYEYPEKTLAKDKKRISYISRLTLDKGADILLEIIPYLENNKNVELHIYGSGPFENKFSSFSNIYYHGTTKNIFDIFKNTDILLSTSRIEGLPLTLTEGLFARIPIVAFEIGGGMKEIVTNEYNGYLIKNFDIKLMKEKIDTLISNNELRNKFGSNSYINSKKFNFDSIMNNWNNIFNSL